MTLNLQDLPVVENSRRMGRRGGADPAVADAYSPQADRGGAGVVALGMRFAELLEQRLFPGPDELAELQRSSGPSYSTYFDCSEYSYGGTCQEPCFGFAPHHMDRFYCATCEEQEADPKNNPSYNWHYTGRRGQIRYRDREPDVCLGRDAWKWKVGACGECRDSAVFRCHDGWKWYPDSTSPDPTICEGLVSCDNRLTTC